MNFPIWLAVLAAIAALLLFLSTRHCRVRVSGGSGEALKTEVRYGFLCLWRSSKKKKHPARLSGRKLRRLLRKKKKRKVAGKPEKGKKKSTAKKKEKTGASGVGEFLSLLDILREFLAEGIYRHLESRLHRLYIRVSAGDAAKTAYAYTAVITSLNGIFSLLDGGKHFSIDRADRVCVLPDFTGGTFQWEADAEFRLRLYHLLFALGKALLRYQKQKNPKAKTLSTLKGAAYNGK